MKLAFLNDRIHSVFCSIEKFDLVGDFLFCFGDFFFFWKMKQSHRLDKKTKPNRWETRSLKLTTIKVHKILYTIIIYEK